MSFKMYDLFQVLQFIINYQCFRLLDYFPRLNSIKSSFRNFNRFSMGTEEKSQLDISPSIGFKDTVTMSELSRGFDNPMYSEPGTAVS